MSISYLGAPYTHTNPEVVKNRVAIINAVAAHLMRKGHVIFSPISHSHPVNASGIIPREESTWDFWRKQDLAFLIKANNLFILKLKGWEKSIGLQSEIAVAEATKKVVMAINIYIEDNKFIIRRGAMPKEELKIDKEIIQNYLTLEV